MFGTKIVPKPMEAINGGLQALIDFDSYQLSVVQHSGSYGGDQGLWEIGVFKGSDMVELPPVTVEGDIISEETISEEDDSLLPGPSFLSVVGLLTLIVFRRKN